MDLSPRRGATPRAAEPHAGRLRRAPKPAQAQMVRQEPEGCSDACDQPGERPTKAVATDQLSTEVKNAHTSRHSAASPEDRAPNPRNADDATPQPKRILVAKATEMGIVRAR